MPLFGPAITKLIDKSNELINKLEGLGESYACLKIENEELKKSIEDLKSQCRTLAEIIIKESNRHSEKNIEVQTCISKKNMEIWNQIHGVKK